MTVEEWPNHHIAHLTGLRKSTLYDCRAYAKNDIVPILGELPLIALSRDDIAQWMQAMTNELPASDRQFLDFAEPGLSRQSTRF